MKLSAHFDLAEFTVSQEAGRRGLDNTPSLAILVNLRRLAGLMEQVRDLLGKPITISSGYRSEKINSIIGGAKNSHHVLGLAADFICPEFGDPYEVAIAISRSAIKYDQLIMEYGSWVHISMNEPPRRQDLSIFKGTGYQTGIKRP